MKILYVANDRRAAQFAAIGLCKIAPDVTVSWTGTLSEAWRWVHANRDLAALIIEAQVDNQGCPSFVAQVRNLGLTAPVIIVSSEEAGPPVAILKAGADDYVATNELPVDRLPDVVSRALQRTHAAARPAKPPTRLLYVGDAALARECLERSGIEVAEALPPSTGTFHPIPPEFSAPGRSLPFDVLLVEHGYPGVNTLEILKDISARHLSVPVILVVAAEEALAVPALKVGAADYVVKRKASFQALPFKLERVLAHSALLKEQTDLRAAQRFLLSVVDALPLYLMRIAHDGTILDVSSAGLAAFGAAHRSGVVGTSIYTYIPEAHRETVRDLIRSVGPSDAPVGDVEFQIVANDGGRRTLKTRTARLAQGEGPASILCIFEDVTERQERERSLRERESQAERLGDAARVERHTLESQLTSARSHTERVQFEHALARKDWEDTRDRLLADAAAAVAAREPLERQVCDALARAAEAERRLNRAAEEHRAQYERGLAETAAARHTLERQLQEAEAALAQARLERASDQVSVEQLAQRDAEFTATLRENNAIRSQLEHRLAEAIASLQRAEQCASFERLAAAQLISERQAEVEARLKQEVAKRETVERSVAEAEAALEHANQERQSEAAAFGDHLARQNAEFAASLAQVVTERATLEQRLTEAQANRARAEQDRAVDAAAAAERLARQKTEFSASFAEAAAIRETLERRLTEAETQVQHVEERASSERLAAQQQAAERQAAFEAGLGQEVAQRERLERQRAKAEAARQQADEVCVQLTGAREALEQQLGEVETALDRARQDRTTDAAAAAERFARQATELTAARAETTATRETLERRLAEAERAHELAEERASIERQAAMELSSQRQAELEARFNHETARREMLERELVVTRAAAEETERRLIDEAAAISQRARQREAGLDEQAARERLDREHVLGEMQEVIRDLQQESETLRSSLVASQEQTRRVEVAQQEERENLERARATSEAEARRIGAELAATRQTMDQVRASVQQTLERVSYEHAAERARLDALITARDRQLEEQTARQSASELEARTARAELEDRLRVTSEARDRDGRQIEQLQRGIQALGQQLEVASNEREAFRAEANRVPQLQHQLQESRAENHRRFDDATWSMCRLSREGALVHANHALVALLGYRTADELRAVDFATAVFESADDLRWVIERCVETGTTESVETAWRKKDSGRLVVRVVARPVASDAIEIVADDLTSLRTLEEKLRQAQRMEAVARLASEVAVTCDNVLRDAAQDGERWLAAMGSDTALRRQGELLLGEVTRAASFLRQLAVYGNKQTSVVGPVDMNKVLRDLEPVLKRVAGEAIELVRPETSAPVNVDVDAERVERVLVNVAAYGRERMPLGGKLMIELATVEVDRRFVAKYPNVRPGTHALITVTAVRRTGRADWPIELHDDPTGAIASGSLADRPGVDLGALQALIRDCGGHLWMTAEPPGDMVLKIHLPQRALDRAADARTPEIKRDRAGWMRRLAGAKSTHPRRSA